MAEDSSYNALRWALGNDSLAVRAANCLYREGIRSLYALNEMSELLGEDAFRARLGEIRNIGTGAVHRITTTVAAYRRGEVKDAPESGERHFVPSALISRDDEVSALFVRARNTLDDIPRSDFDKPVLPGKTDGMTYGDLVSTLRLFFGNPR